MGRRTGAFGRAWAGAAIASVTLFVGAMGAVLPTVSPPVASAAITVPATVTASNWTVAPNISPSLDVAQNGVSCVTSTFCMAVGTLNTASESTAVPAAQVWNGSSWSSVTVQQPASPGSNLDSVSCVSTTWCVAVGQTGVQHNNSDTLIEQWNGSQFSIVSATSPTNQDNLSGVSCLSTSFCMAVGDSAGTSYLLAHWDGTAWSFSTLGLVPGLSEPNLDGVSCGAMNNCMAVGNVYNFGIPGEVMTAIRWDGLSWQFTGVNAPATPIDNSFFLTVSCVGPWFCAAAGYDYNSHAAGGSVASSPLVELWNNPSWGTPETLPAVPNVGQVLDGISCFSDTSCAAVGYNYLAADGNTYNTAALTWDGQTWGMASTPNDSAFPTTSYFNAVDCLTDWACMAVGNSYNGTTDRAFAAWAPIARSGYRFVATDGGIFNYGPGAPFLGSRGGQPGFPIVGMATMPAGDGYWLVASDGGVFGYGSAKYYGSMGGQPLNKPIVGMAATADGGGYWLVASDGGIFSFGDAQFYGSTGAITLNKPIVGMAATPNGFGYYLVASDGGIFNYGNATFAGSMGGQPLNKPVVGMAAPVAGGYYLVASDGGIFSFPTGAAGPPFFGSTGAIVLNKPVIGMMTTAGGKGYYMGAADGGIFSFPEGPSGPTFYGSRGGQPLNAPIVGISG